MLTGAMVAALLFTVHPIHVENVASIVGRADCLCGLFYCCALVAYNRCTTSTNGSSSYKYLLAAWIFGLLASLSKEVGITGTCFYAILYLHHLNFYVLHSHSVCGLHGRRNCVLPTDKYDTTRRFPLPEYTGRFSEVQRCFATTNTNCPQRKSG